MDILGKKLTEKHTYRYILAIFLNCKNKRKRNHICTKSRENKLSKNKEKVGTLKHLLYSTKSQKTMENRYRFLRGQNCYPQMYYCTIFLCEGRRKTSLGSTPTEKNTIHIPSLKKNHLKIYSSQWRNKKNLELKKKKKKWRNSSRKGFRDFFQWV